MCTSWRTEVLGDIIRVVSDIKANKNNLVQKDVDFLNEHFFPIVIKLLPSIDRFDLLKDLSNVCTDKKSILPTVEKIDHQKSEFRLAYQNELKFYYKDPIEVPKEIFQGENPVKIALYYQSSKIDKNQAMQKLEEVLQYQGEENTGLLNYAKGLIYEFYKLDVNNAMQHYLAAINDGVYLAHGKLARLQELEFPQESESTKAHWKITTKTSDKKSLIDYKKYGRANIEANIRDEGNIGKVIHNYLESIQIYDDMYNEYDDSLKDMTKEKIIHSRALYFKDKIPNQIKNKLEKSNLKINPQMKKVLFQLISKCDYENIQDVNKLIDDLEELNIKHDKITELKQGLRGIRGYLIGHNITTEFTKKRANENNQTKQETLISIYKESIGNSFIAGKQMTEQNVLERMDPAHRHWGEVTHLGVIRSWEESTTPLDLFAWTNKMNFDYIEPKTVAYLTDGELNSLQLIRDAKGRLSNKRFGVLLPNQEYLYAFDAMENELYVYPNLGNDNFITLDGVEYYFQHSSFLQGREAASTGILTINNDSKFIAKINNDSGHYQPAWHHLLAAATFIESKGFFDDKTSTITDLKGGTNKSILSKNIQKEYAQLLLENPELNKDESFILGRKARKKIQKLKIQKEVDDFELIN